MARKAKINNAKTYFDSRFECEFLFWKSEDPRTKIAWCKLCYDKCSFRNCLKVNNNKYSHKNK